MAKSPTTRLQQVFNASQVSRTEILRKAGKEEFTAGGVSGELRLRHAEG